LENPTLSAQGICTGNRAEFGICFLIVPRYLQPIYRSFFAEEINERWLGRAAKQTLKHCGSLLVGLLKRYQLLNFVSKSTDFGWVAIWCMDL